MKLKKNKYEILFQKLYVFVVGYLNKIEIFIIVNLLKLEIL